MTTTSEAGVRGRLRGAGPAPSAHHNLPALLTSLVGRERELQGIGETLRTARLVTLTGPGGVGKTRLALEVAHRQVTRRPDGVWLMDLAAGPDTSDVAGETARVLGLRGPRGTTPTDTLRRYLATRDLLLVLDNCEHVVDVCARLADALLSSCEKVRILATSREVLDVPGERVWRLEPLAAADAKRLFVQRARERRSEFTADRRTEAAVELLCERVDRLPLAIELAAARVGAMSPSEILEGLESHLGDLGGGRLAAPRHRTVRATVEWSHNLLDDTEQRVLRSLAVFTGGFDAAAATAVVPGLTADVLTRLVDKSLVSVMESPHGRTRYRLLETVREYESELLVRAGELDAARDRHLRHFASYRGVERDCWPSPEAPRLVAELADDYENVRAALEWAVRSDPCAGLPFYAKVWDLFFLIGQADGVRLGERLLEACPTRDRTRALVQISLGGLRAMQVDHDGVWAIEEEARRLAAELADPALEGWALIFQGLSATFIGALDAARATLTRAVTLHGQVGVRSGEAKAIAMLGLIEMLTGNTARAKEVVEEALAIQLTSGDVWSLGQCHTYLGMIAQASGDAARATAHYRQAVETLVPFRDGSMLVTALALQGGLLARRDPARALKIVAAASTIRARVGGLFPPFFKEQVERAKAAAEAPLGAEADAVWAEGSRLGMDEAIALAFGTATPRASSPTGLSAREMDVVRLVAEGVPNKTIATRLHLSVRTVESHVRHVLAKVGLENRTQLAAWARERIQ